MNFLLRMLGQTYRSPLILRPTPPQQFRAAAASALAAGNLHASLDACRQLATESHGSVGDTFIRAHLHLALTDYSDAAAFFTLGLQRIGDAPLLLDRLLDSGEDSLRHGRFVLATDAFQRARAVVDTLLSAQAGLAVANARLNDSPSPAAAVAAILPLAKIGDLLLRMLARTHLASNLAVCLRERSLRDDLASWATSTTSVQNLLNAEFRLFQEQTRDHSDHAELHYRLGLVTRALDQLQVAAHAFHRVLTLHPHHLPAAARLAATYHQLGQSPAILPVLAMAFAAPPNILEQYAALAAASTNALAFDSTAEKTCRALPPIARPAAKANLAFALSELGLLDDARAQWRETAAVG